MLIWKNHSNVLEFQARTVLGPANCWHKTKVWRFSKKNFRDACLRWGRAWRELDIRQLSEHIQRDRAYHYKMRRPWNLLEDRVGATKSSPIPIKPKSQSTATSSQIPRSGANKQDKTPKPLGFHSRSANIPKPKQAFWKRKSKSDLSLASFARSPVSKQP